MKSSIPLKITLIMGILMCVQYFIPHQASQSFYKLMLGWTRIIGILALMLGLSSLWRMHYRKIDSRVKGWAYNVVTLVSLVITCFIGVVFGNDEGSLFMNIYNFVQLPLQATMFSLLAFYITSAAYRSFRARNWQASLLLIAGVIVMLGRIPIGDYLFGAPGWMTKWIMLIPTTAAMRGILLGVGLGAIATSLKIMLGIERSYLGGGA